MTWKILLSERVEAVPGITLYSLRAAAVDCTGTEWPVGTEYTPSKSGRDNAAGCDYQEVTIAGRLVRFESEW